MIVTIILQKTNKMECNVLGTEIQIHEGEGHNKDEINQKYDFQEIRYSRKNQFFNSSKYKNKFFYKSFSK